MTALQDVPGSKGAVLVVDDDEMILALVSHGLTTAGYRVTTAESGSQALARLSEAIPDVIVSDVNMPDMDGFTLVRRLREDEVLQGVPLLFLTSRTEAEDVVQGLGLGADDYFTKPFGLPELVARVDAKRARPPVPVERLRVDRRSGLAGPGAFVDELARERERGLRSGRRGHVAVLSVHEAESVRLRFGGRGEDELARQIGDALAGAVDALETAGRTEDGRFALLLPESGPDEVQRRLQQLSERIAGTRMLVAGERVSVTPLVGYAELDEGADGEQALQWAGFALAHAQVHLDLRPVAYQPQMLPAYADEVRPRGSHRARPLADRLRVPLQIALTVVIGAVLPYLLYLFSYRAGFDLAPYAYVVVVVALLVTGVSIWTEGLLALDPYQPPPAPEELADDVVLPAASAVIAAYLPNEAATVVETIEAFLRVDYPGPLQVVLAYNSPVELPVEAVLGEIAQREERFTLLKVEGSSSKAQNVNAALAVVTGEFTGVFDADHQPDPDAFRRAHRWMAAGYDIVQGHPVVRNGDASWVARTIAVEFEMIYGVSHPGRAKLHGFGIFGGSNGYWRTQLLRETRFRGSMLTEDIDSALRVVEAGYRIGSDPFLISRELAPTTLKQLWNQRMRWAQGWFQVSLSHLHTGVTSRTLTPRQKFGFSFLLGWREVYPWLSLQMFPIIAFYLTRGDHLDPFVPVFVLTTLFTTSVGPWQTLFAYRQADPAIRAHKRWFWAYLLVSSVFYTEYKNVIARVAQVKQVMREKTWKVTPRTAGAGGAPTGGQTVPAQGGSVNDPGHPALDDVPAT
ncbi:MAG: response regulator receiver modulated diguanylate cyclase [Frankiales bacterium]|nr:response regulator receiver modulated diguanylate cyclase [Frankiales bacterium]